AVVLVLAGACAPISARGPAPAGEAGLAARLDAIFSDTAFSHPHVGALVVSLTNGHTIYQRNASKVFPPASSQTLLPGAAALAALGPAYRFPTTVWASGQVRGGVLRGDLIVRGSGDPTFSGRFYPD